VSDELTGIQLVAIADPLQAGLGYVVEGYEVEVSRQTMKGADAELVQSREEVLSNVYWPVKALRPDIFSRHGDDSEIQLIANRDL
jgi:hypothetical protein